MYRAAGIAATLLLTGPQMAWADGGPVGPSTWWRAWTFDPLVLFSLGSLAWIYHRGLARLWSRAGVGSKVNRWQAASYFSALLVIGTALLSPLDRLSGELSSLHMVQHMLLTVVAAPLFVLGSPNFVLAWGIPELRKGVASRVYTCGLRLPQDAVLWQPMFVWGLFAGSLWVWHHPLLYETALRDPLVHDAQHLSFFLVSCLFWRVCLDPLSTRRLNPAAAIPYLFTTSVHTSALGVFLALSPQAWYDEYAGQTSAWGLTLLEDQQLAGLIMWIPSCLCYPAVAAVLLGNWLARSEPIANGNPVHHARS